ncbi:unnamed protein product [Pleuronectes platessa]|uniref:Uncharacterized protein n=1 Tax=Pleuronectes platessa TaxID=8262 RepID=A0A9N7Z110_PLEPL|nr:unnamed protein product [Pleuronectes platessa]
MARCLSPTLPASSSLDAAPLVPLIPRAGVLTGKPRFTVTVRVDASAIYGLAAGQEADTRALYVLGGLADGPPLVLPPHALFPHVC